MHQKTQDLLVIFAASVGLALSINVFLLPHQTILGGISGTAMIVELTTGVGTALINFLLNIPIFILGYLQLGKRFIGYSLYSLMVTTVALAFIPVMMVTEDALLSVLFGGILNGLSVGIIIKHGGSTGGFDIIGLVVTKYKEMKLGVLMTAMNFIVVGSAGYLFGMEATLYSLVGIFVSGKMVDMIHTSRLKIALNIVTKKGEDVTDAIVNELGRGVTCMSGEGGYTQEQKAVLMTVITRYEWSHAKEIVQRIDPQAFMTLSGNVEVVGSFKRKNQ